MTTKLESLLDFDLSKYLTEFKTPGVDVDAIVSVHKKNMETLTAANKLAYEGFQAVVRRQAEIIRQTMEDASTASSTISDLGSANDRIAKQTALMKEAFEKNLSNVKELAELLIKSNNEVFDLLSARVSQSLDEVKTQLEAAPAAAKAAAPADADDAAKPAAAKAAPRAKAPAA